MGERRIAVISDTHDLLRDGVLEKLQKCDAILHGGDISSQAVLDTLKSIAPVYAVRGNADDRRGENTLFLNPGSCGPRKSTQPVTMAIIHLSDDMIISEKVEL